MKNYSNNQSLGLLILANLIAIILSVWQGWNFGTVLWGYWFQSIIIGIFSWRKILDLKDFSTKNFKINGQAVQATRKTKLFTAWFFLFHYGFFHLIYAIFLGVGISFVDWPGVFIVAIIFLINHTISYKKNKAQDQLRKPNIGVVMFFPYVRIIPMHFIIMLGFIITDGVYGLILFLLFKTAADSVMHLIEHNQMPSFRLISNQ